MTTESAPASKFTAIAERITKMTEVDQDMRARNLEDDTHRDDSIDKTNTEEMRAIIAEIGWPTITKVGEDASHDAWLLVQHADHDPAFQKACLELMKQADAGEVLPENIAYLEDRVAVNHGQPQVYGTQLEQKDGKFVPRSIIDSENVNTRRMSIGLDTIEEYLARVEKKYQSGKS
jgi:hypothetical protein